MPQVDPVRPDADPAQRPDAGERGDDPVSGRRGDQAGRGERGQQQADRVDDRIAAGEVPDGPGQDDEPGDAGHVKPPGVRGRDGRQPPQRPGQRQRGPDQQRGGVRVGAVVDRGRIAARIVLNHHDQRRNRRPGQRAYHSCATRIQPDDHTQHDQRPDQVELLLDGQRPQVIKWRRRRDLADRGEVRDVMQDLVPVARVGGRGQQRQAERGLLGGLDDGRRGSDHHQHHSQRWQQAPGPPGPEVRQVQAAGAVPPGHQQIGDQEPAEHEEDVDAEEPAGQPGSPFVEADHGEDGQRPDPVEAGRTIARSRGFARFHRLAVRRPFRTVMLTSG